MPRLSKLFVWLLAVYIVTVIIFMYKLRDSSSRLQDSLHDDEVVILDNFIKQNRADNTFEVNYPFFRNDVYAIDPDYVGDKYIGGINDEVPNDIKEDNVEVYEDEYIDVERYVRFGPGENGAAVNVSNEGKRAVMATQTARDRWKFHGFNTYVSDIISLQRKVQDLRPEACKSIRYPADMKPASVVIIFRDEWPSVVLRTAYSVLGASPENLLKEIVLVDDGSTDLELKTIIDIHVSNVEKLKLVRNPTPQGLMLARQKGIEATTSEYFVVMDGHMEVGPGWLEPLIARLQEVPQALLCSHVGELDPETFQFHVDEDFKKTFPFYDPLTLSQMWARYSDKFRSERFGSVAPLPTGTIQGMIAAMRKDFFLQLGGFDPGMRQWGSEQMELSLKVWMCGGRVELVPCSKVAHMYRRTPWARKNTTSDFLVANALRTADVWLDDPYKNLIHYVIGKHSQYKIGNLTDRRRIRQENNCKPFQHFVDMVKTFSDVYLPRDIKAKGTIVNKKSRKCLAVDKQIDNSFKISIGKCRTSSKYNFILTEHDQIRSIHGTTVRTLIGPDNITTVGLVKSTAYIYRENAVWEYKADRSLYNVVSNSCLTPGAENTLVVEKCTGSENQLWKWQRL